MKALLIGLLFVCGSSFAAPADVEGSSDHKALPERFGGSYILGYVSAPFERLILPLGRGEVDVNTGADTFVASKPVEGELTRIVYVAPATATPLEMYRNYQMALDAAGFESLFVCSRDECGPRFNQAICPPSRALTNRANLTEYACYSLSQDHHFIAAERDDPNGTTWVSLYVLKNELPSEPGLNQHPVAMVEIVQKAAVANRMVLVRADEMSRAISQEGKVSLYGIYFDTDAAEVKSDSEPTLVEIARLLQGNPALRVHVVGHTDNVGAFGHNMDLSQRRAKAVVTRLIEGHRAPADRLAAHGVGPLAPVATNSDAAGRARNRRVEIVAQ